MVLKRPVAGAPVLVEDFGQPVYDLVNQPAWVGFAFVSAEWQNYVGFQACVYRKVGTRVELRGVAQRKGSNLPAGTGSIIANLPASFRPLAQLICPSLVGFADVGSGRIDIGVDGNIKVTPAVVIPVDGYVGFTIVFWTD